MTVQMPDAIDLDPASIRPTGALVDSRALLDDHAALDRRYETDGYLYFRRLIDIDVVRRARGRMIAALEQAGLARADGEQAIWTGGDGPTLSEISPAYSGIVDELVTDPRVLPLLEKILGEPAKTVPMVQYRAYKPHNRLGGVHQDGFYSPGIAGYRPLWIALIDMEPAMGGLVLHPNYVGRGFLHNLAKPPRCPMPAGILPEQGWSRADYRAGDVVVLHPHTPHVGLPNTSGHIRLSIDTRVQSVARPSTIVGDVIGVAPGSITLRTDDGAALALVVDDETFIRTGDNPSVRMSRTELVDRTVTGARVLAAVDGDHALMLRRADPG
jgi:hypothetical protein